MLNSLLTGMNNFGSQVGNNFNTLTAGTDGGFTDKTSDNAERLTDASNAADSKVTNASVQNFEVQAENAIQSMIQKATVNHLNNAATAGNSIQY